MYRHYQRIISRWPTDAVRPESVSFPAALRRRLEKRILTPSKDAAESAGGNETQATVPRMIGEKEELERVNALYSLLENRYSKTVRIVRGRPCMHLECFCNICRHELTTHQYPVSERMLRPASNPSYYTNLMKELEEAPKRSRFGKWLNSWKGFLRMS